MEVHTKDIPIRMLPWPSYLSGDQGYAETRLKIEGRLDGTMTIGGNISSEGPRLSLRQGKRKQAYSPASMSIHFKSVIEGKRFDVPSIQIKTPDMSLSGALAIDLSEESNPWVDLKVTSPFVPVGSFKKFVPLPVLPAWVDKNLFPLLERGIMRLADLSLRGKYKDIQKLHLPKNRSLLSLRIECSDLKIFKEGMSGPIHDVSAVIALKKGKLAISGLGGASNALTPDG